MGTKKNQRAVYELVNILDDQVYEWVCFFRYMNGVGFEILARTPVPKLPVSYRSAPPSPVPAPSELKSGHSERCEAVFFKKFSVTIYRPSFFFFFLSFSFKSYSCIFFMYFIVLLSLLRLITCFAYYFFLSFFCHISFLFISFIFVTYFNNSR